MHIEGLGRSIYPQLDIWRTGRPLLEAWMMEAYGPSATLRKLQARAPEWMAQLPEMPDLLRDALENLRHLPYQQRQLEARPGRRPDPPSAQTARRPGRPGPCSVWRWPWAASGPVWPPLAVRCWCSGPCVAETHCRHLILLDSAKEWRTDMSEILTRLHDVLEARKGMAPESSYVASLYHKGLNKILEKVGEEAVETILAAPGCRRRR